MQDLTNMKFGLEKKKFLKPNKSVHIKKFKKKKNQMNKRCYNLK